MAATDGNYVTIAEVREAGIDPLELSDQEISDKIHEAENFIEMSTGRWFYKRTGITLVLDGGDNYSDNGVYRTTDVLNLPVPALNLTGVSIDGLVKTIGNYVALSRIGPPIDDRWYPRIISKSYDWPEQGIQNISLAGDFGFVEDIVDFKTPPLIKKAALKLTIRMIELDQISGDQSLDRQMQLNIGNIQEERMPGYSYKLFNRSKSQEEVFYTGDYEIDSTIEMYRYKRFVVAI